MFLDVAVDMLEVGLMAALACGLLALYVRHRKPHWKAGLTERRLALLAMSILAATAVRVIDEVVSRESGPIDEAMLWFVRNHVPAAWHGFFAAVTLSGSAMLLVPLAVIASGCLIFARRRFEALLLSTSAIAATLVVWAMKGIVDRARPALWETQWYWGSSFPSGHTLSTAAFSTAAALCVARIEPRAANTALALAVLWTSLVALSRLVLGVHWPSDVLAAMCLGAFIPLFTSVAHRLRGRQAAA